MFCVLVMIAFIRAKMSFKNIFAKYQDLILHLLSDPLGNKVVAEDDDGGAGNKPKCVEAEKGIIEAALQQKSGLFSSLFGLKCSTFSG